jgi:membrane protease YdiL (CAAX protease family)
MAGLPTNGRKAQTVALAMLFETGLGFVGVLIAWAGGINLATQLVVSQDAVLRGVLAAFLMIVLLVAGYESGWQPLESLRREVEKVVQEMFAGCRWFEFALVSIAAGVGEELLFRGALQPLLVQWTGPWIGVTVIALLFGLAHALTPAYFVAATVIGVYFGWLALAYDDLVAPIVAHAVYDFVALMFIQFRAGKDNILPPAT